MKNFAIIIAVIFSLVFAGCADQTQAQYTTEATTEVIIETTAEVTTEPTAEVTTTPTEEMISNIPNAKEFPEMDWPTFGAATKIPTPEWSNHGEILIDSETGLWVQVGYSTLDDYRDYMKACQDAGYIENYYNVAGYMYYGENADGYAVQLTYNQYDHYISIQVTAFASEWNKWWVEETEGE